VRDILDRYAQGAVDRLGPGTFCSITIRDGGSLMQVGSNDPRAAACDRLEVQEGDGPCIAAMQELSGVVVADTAEEDRWTSWAAAALANGFRSLVALPGFVDEDTTVALNVYAEEVDAWDVRTLVGMDAYVQEVAEAVRDRLGL
jgi:hypothetical protein